MAHKWRRQHLKCIVSDPQTTPSSAAGRRIKLFRFTCLYGCFPSPKKTGLTLRHEKGLSTTFRSQGSTIADFFGNRQALYLRFCFANSGMVEGDRFNVVDGRISWRKVRPKAQGGRPRIAILDVAVEYGLNWPLKGKNTPYSTATYREIGLRGGRGRRIERLIRRRR